MIYHALHTIDATSPPAPRHHLMHVCALHFTRWLLRLTRSFNRQFIEDVSNAICESLYFPLNTIANLMYELARRKKRIKIIMRAHTQTQTITHSHTHTLLHSHSHSLALDKMKEISNCILRSNKRLSKLMRWREGHGTFTTSECVTTTNYSRSLIQNIERRRRSIIINWRRFFGWLTFCSGRQEPGKQKRS